MIEKLSVLIVCLTPDNTVTERAVIRNCQDALRNNLKVLLYITKKSFIDNVVDDKSVTKIYAKLKKNNNIFSLIKYYSIRTIFKDFKIDIVHCYDIYTLWPFTFIMRESHLIPLVYTHSKILSRSYRGHIFSLLRRRLDMVTTSSPYLGNNISEKIGIKPSKIIQDKMELASSEIYNLFSKKGNVFFLGTYASEGDKQIDNLMALIFAIKLLNDQSDLSVKLIIIFDYDYQKILIAKIISNLIDELNLHSNVFFYVERDLLRVIGSFDLWVDVSSYSVSYDYSLAALLNKIPVLLPRDILNIEILEQAAPLNIGCTYSQGNARDIMRQMDNILTDVKKYKSDVSTFSSDSNFCGSARHISEHSLFENYARLISLRDRFYSRGNK